MGILDHAQKELERAGMFDKDADYNGAIAVAVMELMKVFAKQKHSGFSAMMVVNIFNTLGKMDILSPRRTA